MSSVSDEDVNKIEPVVITTNKVPPGLYVPAQTYEGEKGKNFNPFAVRRVYKRAIFKNGDINIIPTKRPNRLLRFLRDHFTTMVNAQWRWCLLAVAGSSLISWLLFAVMYWLIFFVHGDLEPHHLPPFQDEENFTPCVAMIYDFTSCFLFSIETQTTIGYGDRMITEECPEAIFLVGFQSMAAVIIDGYFGGIFGAKICRPKDRTHTLLISRNAVICERDGNLCLMFRVADMRKTFLTEASVRALLIRSNKTKEGEVLEPYIEELTISADEMDSDLFFMWPLTVVHEIDKSSPFWNMSAADMLQAEFEIVVLLEGSHLTTGQDVQRRSSFVPTEVLWGHRFEDTINYTKDEKYNVDFSKFDNTIPVETPFCAAADLKEFYENKGSPNQLTENGEGSQGTSE